jgi:pimeloyl-ACP methyl ester carboxylesterase
MNLKSRLLPRRAFLGGTASLAVLSGFGGWAQAEVARKQGEREQSVGKEIVMVHGASEGGWCFDRFRVPFEERGWTVHAPDLIGHGSDKADAKTTLAGVSLADYRRGLMPLLKSFASPPVLLGHSMGALLAQQLAAEGLARALVLVNPAPRAGILPSSDSEKDLAQGFMTIPSFWTTVIDPDFDLACFYSMNKVPKDEQRALFDKFGPESGLAYYQMFFWMIDKSNEAAVDTDSVTCPVLVVAGIDDNLVSLATARATATGYRQAAFWEEPGHGHMLPVEPGAGRIAGRIADWVPA